MRCAAGGARPRRCARTGVQAAGPGAARSQHGACFQVCVQHCIGTRASSPDAMSTLQLMQQHCCTDRCIVARLSCLLSFGLCRIALHTVGVGCRRTSNMSLAGAQVAIPVAAVARHRAAAFAGT